MLRPHDLRLKYKMAKVTLVLGMPLHQVLRTIKYQVPRADVEAVVYCKPGAIENVNRDSHCHGRQDRPVRVKLQYSTVYSVTFLLWGCLSVKC